MSMTKASASSLDEKQGLEFTLAMFPGQGSQYVGMGQEILAQFPALKVVFEEVEDATSVSIRKLCLQGPEEQLNLTEFTQPCILAVSVAMWRCLVQESPVNPDYYAGHSLGEYSALVAAGKLSLSRAAYLVHQRGRAMQQAVPVGIGAMAAVLMVPEERLRILCQEAVTEAPKVGLGDTGRSRDQAAVLEIVNFNAPTQLVVAGHRKAVEILLEKVSAHKGKAVLLPVSAPFHSSLMRPARDVMEDLLKSSEFHSNGNRIFSNTTAKSVAEYRWEILADQIHSPVLWYQTLNQALTQGCSSFLEVGPGKVLTGLAKRQIPKDAWLQNCDNIRDLIGLLQKRS